MIKFESEKHLEDFIFGEFKNNFECIITGEVFNNCKRQLHIGAYGIPDLVFYSCDNDEIEGGTPIVYRKIHVIELKNEQIKVSDLSQIARYKRYFERALFAHDVAMEFSLVVPTGVSKNADAVWLIDQMDGISVYEFSLNPREGIEFKEMSDWYRKDENLEIARSILGIESEEGGK